MIGEHVSFSHKGRIIIVCFFFPGVANTNSRNVGLSLFVNTHRSTRLNINLTNMDDTTCIDVSVISNMFPSPCGWQMFAWSFFFDTFLIFEENECVFSTNFLSPVFRAEVIVARIITTTFHRKKYMFFFVIYPSKQSTCCHISGWNHALFILWSLFRPKITAVSISMSLMASFIFHIFATHRLDISPADHPQGASPRLLQSYLERRLLGSTDLEATDALGSQNAQRLIDAAEPWGWRTMVGNGFYNG